MTALEVFQFPANGAEIRTVIRDGEPWFVAADVCVVLGLNNVTEAVRHLDDDERDHEAGTNRTSFQPAPRVIISEAGLYSLILRSRKAEAKAFKRWITHEVLPAIRQTGRYEAAPVAEVSRRDLARMVIEAEDARELAEAQRDEARAELAVALPAAEAWHTLASADGDFSVADAAKILSRDPAIRLGGGRLFTRLFELGWIYRQRCDNRWRVRQTAVDIGRLSEIPASHYHPRTGELVLDAPQVRVTFKGLVELHRLLGGTGQLQIPGMTTTTMRPLPALPPGEAAAGQTPVAGGVAPTTAPVARGWAADPSPGSAAPESP
jgi:anti-repressor protein